MPGSKTTDQGVDTAWRRMCPTCAQLGITELAVYTQGELRRRRDKADRVAAAGEAAEEQHSESGRTGYADSGLPLAAAGAVPRVSGLYDSPDLMGAVQQLEERAAACRAAVAQASSGYGGQYTWGPEGSGQGDGGVGSADGSGGGEREGRRGSAGGADGRREGGPGQRRGGNVDEDGAGEGGSWVVEDSEDEGGHYLQEEGMAMSDEWGLLGGGGQGGMAVEAAADRGGRGRGGQLPSHYPDKVGYEARQGASVPMPTVCHTKRSCSSCQMPGRQRQSSQSPLALAFNN